MKTGTQLATRFGSHLTWILRQPHPAATAHSRAVGAWYANMLDTYSDYLDLQASISAVDSFSNAMTAVSS